MSTYFRMALSFLFLVSACKEAPVEPANLEGSATITYALEGLAQGPISIEATATGYRISAPSTGLPPEEVAANLRNGRDRLPFYDMGILWIEPSERKIGGKTHLGTIVGEATAARRPAFKMQERNGRVDYWFCKETGFLVQRRENPSGPTLTLVNSTVPGL